MITNSFKSALAPFVICLAVAALVSFGVQEKASSAEADKEGDAQRISGAETANKASSPGRVLFKLDFGLGTVFFSKCGGMGSINDVIEQIPITRDRGRDDEADKKIIKIPGKLRFSDITCVRALTNDSTLWDWRQLVVNGDFERARTPAQLTKFNKSGTPIFQWDLQDSWPSGLVQSTYRETITIVVNSLKAFSL